LKLGIEGSEEGRWILLDYGDFIVHVFTEESRQFYQLERLWRDAERVELPERITRQ
jgi:ribosome-associated protein